jgi:hypothetical protein
MVKKFRTKVLILVRATEEDWLIDDWLIIMGWDMSQNCRHQRAYYSFPGWYVSMEGHGDDDDDDDADRGDWG